MQANLRRLGLGLAGLTLTALTLASAGSATHLGYVQLGHENTGVPSMTSIRGFSNQPQLYATNEWGNAIAAISYAPNGIGVYGIHQATGGLAPGVRGDTYSLDGGAGVEGNAFSPDGYGVQGWNTSGGTGVYGLGGTAGVLGSSSETGVRGIAGGGDGDGVHGIGGSSFGGFGVFGEGYDGLQGVGASYGVIGIGRAAGIYGGPSPLSGGWAAWFQGNVKVTGAINPAAAASVVDHPRDPANAYLRHSFVQSAEMKNVYDGVVTTDARGFATVRLPRYFQALNRDFRYQLTVIGKPGTFVEAMVVREVANNRFRIQSEEPQTKVSWQVTGIRKDAYANANRVQVEQAKPAREQGRYLHPELYGKPKTAAVGYRPMK